MKIRGLRWWIAAMLFGAAVLNYVDRQTLSLLAPTIQRDLHMDDGAYAWVVNAFLIAYILSNVFSGPLVDRLGTRAAYALFIGWWSVANVLTGFVRSTASMAGIRAMLGLGEAGNWIASPKVVSEWFPAHERGLAIGLYTMGGTVGATVAPLLIVPLGSRYGWPAAFAVTGLLGLLWLLPWLWLYQTPQYHPRITEAERSMLQTVTDPEQDVGGTGAAWTWRQMLSHKWVWALMLGRLLTDPVWYFYQFWFAKYLFSVRHVEQKDLTITWVVFLAADLGGLVGGWISGRLIRGGARPAASRMRSMFFFALLMPLAPVVALSPSVNVVLAAAVVVVFAHLAWLINLSALVVDVVPKRSLGKVFGWVAAGSALGGVLMNSFVAWLVTHRSYTDWFVLTAFLHPAAWLVLRATRLHQPALANP